MVLSTVLSLPPSLYKEFVLEEKFGFNKQTLRIFITDILKGQALTLVLGSPIIAALLAIIQKTGDGFYYYVWLFNIGIQLFMISIYPVAILPLFNKLSPLKDGELKEGVEALAKRLDFPLSELFVIDGSKRSAHSNAYFFGLPWKKHIVIYDTLIEKSETQEIVAVLGHELGHWNLSHTIKLFGLSQVRPCIFSVRFGADSASSFMRSISSRSFPSSSITAHYISPSVSTTNTRSSSAYFSLAKSWHRWISSSLSVRISSAGGLSLRPVCLYQQLLFDTCN